MNEILINVNNLNKTYDNLQIINNISFNIIKGNIISLIGPSGCGKSTILNIISGLENQTSGSINATNNIGYMLQQDSLFPWLTVYENCILGLQINNKLAKDNIEYIKKLLTDFKLEDFTNSYPSNLSGGMKQRVALIRTLALKPDIILLDEPLSALDYQSRLKISEDIYKIIKNNNITCILVTHDIEEAISLSDEIIILSKRPASIKKIIKTNFNPKDTPLQRRKSSEFANYFQKVWRSLDEK